MPIYEYACRDCGHEFELLVRGEEKPSCPHCGLYHLTRHFSATAAHASGTGTSASCPMTGKKVEAGEAPGCGLSNCCGSQCGMAEWMR